MSDDHPYNWEIGRRLEMLAEASRQLAGLFGNLKCPSKSHADMLDHIPQEDLDTFLEEMDSILFALKTTVSKKITIPINSQMLFRTCHEAEAALGKAAALYLRARADMFEKYGDRMLSRKSTGRLAKHKSLYMLEIFQPKTRDEALFMSFYGVQCEKCDSYRIVSDVDTTHVSCMDCNHKFEAATIPSCPHCGTMLFCHLLNEINENGKCPECSYDIPFVPERFIRNCCNQ